MFLKKLDNKRFRRLSYDIECVVDCNRVDFNTLHSFIDELYRLSKELGPECGLVHAGIPLLSPLEIRWLDPFFVKVLIYMNTISKVIDLARPDKVYAVGHSQIVDMARDIAAKKGIGFSQKKGLLELPLSLMTPWRVVPDYRPLCELNLRGLPSKVEVANTFPAKKRPRVLFIGWFDRTMERLAAALPALRVGLDADLFLLSSRRVSLTGDLRRAGLICSYSHEWLSRQEGERLMSDVGHSARLGWEQLKRQASSRLGHSWYGLPIFPYAEPILKGSCLEGGKLSAFFVEVAKRAIDSYQPDMLVCFEDWELPRAATLVCRQRNIPTVIYAALSNNAYTGLVRRPQEWMATAGEVLYRGYHRQFKEGHIRVVGDTLVDRTLETSKEEVRRKVCSDLGLNAERPVVLLLSVYSAANSVAMKDIELLYKKTSQAVKGISGAQLVVKTHPLQPTRDVKEWMRSWGCHGQVVDNYNLLSLCRAADIVSVPVTTAVWQAMLAKTPVVTIQERESLEKFQDMEYGYLDNKGVVYISPDEDPVPMFEKLIFDPSFRRTQIQKGVEHVQEHVGLLDGHAAERLTNFFIDILHTSLSRNEGKNS
jgi:hypothetical protein